MQRTGRKKSAGAPATRGENTRSAAQAAARALLTRAGPSVTLQSVAQAVGRPRTGLLFHYPAGMPQLVAALAVEDYEKLRQRLTGLRTRRPDPRQAADAVFSHLLSLGRVAAAEIGAAWEWPPEVEFRVNRSRMAAIAEAGRIAGNELRGRVVFLLAADALADVLHERLTPEQAREKVNAFAGELG